MTPFHRIALFRAIRLRRRFLRHSAFASVAARLNAYGRYRKEREA